ncbi:MAG: SDR family oxidoreductase [Stackebrandtia sp.]
MSKTIMVTGANRGIGRQLAERLVERGWDVLALGRDREALSQLGCRTVVADLERPEELAEALPRLERLDALVHNAGVAELGAVAELSIGSWQRQLTVNLVAAAELTRLLLPALRAARGHVLFVNSGAGWSPASREIGGYAASKHGLKALADALRDEERGNGVRVTSFYPSHTDTDMQRHFRSHLDAAYDPQRAISAGSAAEVMIGILEGPPDAVVEDMRLMPPNPLPMSAKGY